MTEAIVGVSTLGQRLPGLDHIGILPEPHREQPSRKRCVSQDGRGAGVHCAGRLKNRHDLMVAPMKRVFEWAFWAIGTVAIAYLALYLYASLTGRQFEPGDPIHIFRSPDAPDYS
jgi:hypothetical protein